MQGPIRARGDERKRNRGTGHPAQLDLGLFRRLGEPLQGLAVAAEIDSVLALEAICQPVDDAAIPVIPAQLGVAAGGLDIEDPLGNPQHRNVKGAAPQVEYQHPFDRAAIKAVGQGRSCGFVEDSLHTDPGEPPRIAGGLTLGVVEVGRHGDHRSLHRLAQVGGGIIHKLAQDAGHQLFRGIFTLGSRADNPHAALVVGPHRVGHRQAALLQFVPLAAHKPLEVGEGIAGVEHQLAPGQLPHQQLLIAAEAHH